MNGLNQVRDAVLAALKGAGLCAVAAWDGTAKRYPGAVAAVDVAAVERRPMAMGSYLGQVYDASSDTVRELYGRSLTFALSVEIRAALAADCETACERAADVLLSGGLPSGVRLGEQSWEPVRWDEKNRMFLRKGCARGSAYFTAETDSDGGALLEFTLKGVLHS